MFESVSMAKTGLLEKATIKVAKRSGNHEIEFNSISS
jgi:hypothetical protein